MRYAGARTGRAAVGFIDDLQALFERISQHPASGSPRYAHELDLPDLRCGRLRRDPYLVFYMEREDHVGVWPIFDSSDFQVALCQ